MLRTKKPLLALALALLPALAFAGDVVFKTDGSKLRGKIVEESAREVTIETPGGKMVVPRSQISRIERDGDAAKEYETRKGKLSKTDAEGWYQLGKWCQTQKGDTAAKALECWNEVIRIAPDHEAARAELGHKKQDGKWLTEEEWYSSRGYVKHDGRWVTPEDREKLAAGLVLVDGEWVEPPEEPEAEGEVDPEKLRAREEAKARRRAALEAARAAKAAEEEKGGGEAKKPSRKGKGVQFRAMSFNIRFEFPEDVTAGRSWENRRDLIAKTVRLADADLVGMQEDKTDQVKDVQDRLPEYDSYAGKGRNGGNSGEHCMIMWKRESFRAREQGDFWLSDTPDKEGSNTWGDKYPRKVTWVLLEPKDSGDKAVLALNLHYPEGNNANHLREKGSKVIRTWLDEKLGPKGIEKLTVIATGDFNADVDEAPRKILAEGLLRDTYVEAKASEPSPGTFGDWGTVRSSERIDWILIGGPGRAVAYRKMGEQIDGKWASDHYAITADVEIR